MRVNLKECNTLQFYYRNLSAPAAAQLIRLVCFSHHVTGVNMFPSHTKALFLYLLCFKVFTLLYSDLITHALITAWAFRLQTWARALREVIRSALLSDTLLTHARKPLPAGFILPMLLNWLKGLVALFICTSITVHLFLVYLFKTGLGCAISPF